MKSSLSVGVAIEDAATPHWTEPVRHWARSMRARMMIVSLDRRLIWANNEALTALEEGEDVRLRGGLVTMATSTATDAFAAFLARTETVGAWALERDSGDGCLLFKAERIAGADSSFAVSFHGTGSDFRLLWADFSGVFGLTPSEHRVVQLLLAGRSAVDVARELAVSIETVRTHLRRTYAKLEVSCREELFLRLAPFRI